MNATFDVALPFRGLDLPFESDVWKEDEFYMNILRSLLFNMIGLNLKFVFILAGISRIEKWCSQILLWRWRNWWTNRSAIYSTTERYQSRDWHWSKRQGSCGSFKRKYFLCKVILNSSFLSFYYRLQFQLWILELLKTIRKSRTSILTNHFSLFSIKYFNRFAVDSKLNVWKNTDLDLLKIGEIFKVPGAAHGDDLCYLFR